MGGTGRRIGAGKWAGWVAVGAVLVGLSGCTAGAGEVGAGVEPGAPASTEAGEQGSDETPGAQSLDETPGVQGSDETPGAAPGGSSPCVAVSAAALAAVNAVMTAPDHDPEGAPPVMTALTAAPDPDHAVWLLVGSYDRIANSEGHLVVWASTADPTLDTFDGTLRAVGSGTATITAAPVLQFTDVGPGGFPEAALRCAAAGDGSARVP